MILGKPLIPTIALIAVLAMAPVAPEAGNIIFLAMGATGLLLMWPEAREHFPRPIVWMPLLGLLLVGIAFFASSGVEGLAGLLYFSPLLAIWPLVTLLHNVERTPYILLLAVLALCGASGAGLMALTEVQMTGTTRAGEMVANPIHFADVALLVGFIALMGLFTVQSAWKFAFLLALPMSAMAVVLSGTRGAVVAMAIMLITAALTAAWTCLLPRRVVLLALAGLVAVGAVLLALGGSQISGVQRVLIDIADTISTGAPTDYSTSLRLQMYLGGFRAFLESPLVGHGPLGFTAIADSLADVSFGGAPHLHNDLVDMAASAGILGVAAYALFLLAPVIEALRAPPGRLKSSSLLFVVTLVTGYFVMGLTNAMFGILTVTTTFAAICVIAGLLTDTAKAGQNDQDPT